MIHILKWGEKLRWLSARRRLKYCGSGTEMGIFFVLKGAENIVMGSGCHLGRFTELSVWSGDRRRTEEETPELIIGNNVKMAGNCYLSCTNRIVIGNGCLLGVNTFISDNLHGDTRADDIRTEPDLRILYSKGPVVLGDNVLTGRNVCIMPGVSIGEGSIIGANAVVTHDVPPYSVAAGVPARVIRISMNIGTGFTEGKDYIGEPAAIQMLAGCPEGRLSRWLCQRRRNSIHNTLSAPE